ncbi:MAG: 30S ribosomal protein S9 [Chloroflexi bacterium]|nr:30S ribosomal protein S9 [Chloroflexota bacterium]
MAAEVQFYQGVGRRKTSTAQVRLYPGGQGRFMVNGKTAEEFFSRQVDFESVMAPLRIVEMDNAFDISVLVSGGGVSGQAGAIRHGIARALLGADEEWRVKLRQGGFLTRDPREKERKKPGLKRARKAPQYTKR